MRNHVDRRTGFLDAYVSRLLLSWPEGKRFICDTGTLMSVDIVGFTALSERLAAMGRRGAEEVTDLVNGVFTEVIDHAESLGGDVLTFGGDGLTIWFAGEDQTAAAVQAARRMHTSVAQPRSTGSAGPQQLAMSVGMHTGQVWFFRVDPGHQDVVVTGPGATAAVDAESAANPGEILMTEAAAVQLSATEYEVAPDGRYRVTGAAEASSASAAARDFAVLTAAPHAPARSDAAKRFVPGAQAAAISAGLTDGEHRIVTSAFIRLADLDDLLASFGPEHVADRLDGLSRTVAAALAVTGVHWIQSDAYPAGAKILLAAGAPTSTGADEEAMLHAARLILDADVDLDIRIGVNRGPTFLADVGSRTSRRAVAVMSDAVNLSARVMGKAGPREVLASADVVLHAGDRVSSSPVPAFVAKGKTEPVHACRIDGVLGPPTTTADRSSPFIGRDVELSTLEAHVQSLKQDRVGTTVTICAPTGVGKTRLLEELRARTSGVRWLSLRADRFERQSVHALSRRLLGAVLGEDRLTEGVLSHHVATVLPNRVQSTPLLGDVSGHTMRPTLTTAAIDLAFRLEQVASLTADLIGAAVARRGPTVVVLDDLQWADEGSTAVLRALSSRLAESPLLLIAALQEPTLNLSASAVMLQPLGAAETVDLVRALSDDLPDRRVSDVANRSGGNPLYAEELVAGTTASGADGTAGAALPETLEALVAARLDALAPTDRGLLRDAAVIGRVVPVNLLTAISGSAAEIADDWLERVGNFVVREDADTFSFIHDLYQQAAYAALRYRRRTRLHRLVGEALEETGADQATLALHFDRGEDHARAWRYGRAAGLAARDRDAVAQAGVLLQSALVHASRIEVDAVEVAAVWESLGDVREVDGQFTAAEEAFRAADALLDDVTDAVRVKRKIGLTKVRRGEFDDARTIYAAAWSGCDAIPEQPVADRLRAEVAVAVAGVDYREGDFEACENQAREAAHRAVEGGNRRALAHAFQLLDLAVQARRGDDSYQGWAAPMFAAAGDLIGEGNALNNEGIAAYYAGELDTALEAYRRSHDVRKRAGDIMGQAMSTNNIGEVLSDQGRFDEAATAFDSAARDWQAAGYPLGRAIAESNLGRLEIRRGSVTEGRRHLQAAKAQFQSLEAAQYLLETEGRLAEADLADGNTAAAYERVAELLGNLERGLLPEIETWLRSLLAEATTVPD